MISKKRLMIGLAVAAMAAGAAGAAFSLPDDEEHTWYYNDASMTGPVMGKAIRSCTGRTYYTGTITPYGEVRFTHPCYVFEDPGNPLDP